MKKTYSDSDKAKYYRERYQELLRELDAVQVTLELLLERIKRTQK